MSKLFILYITFLTIFDYTIARPNHDNYAEPQLLQRLPNENNIPPLEYPEYDQQVSEKQQTIWQALLSSRNPEDEAYVRYHVNNYQNWPNKEWMNQYGKRNSNSYMSMCHFKICNMGRRKKF